MLDLQHPRGLVVPIARALRDVVIEQVDARQQRVGVDPPLVAVLKQRVEARESLATLHRFHAVVVVAA